MGGFLLGPIKKPVSSSVSKSLLWHSRQLRKHLKAPEKPDNTSLVECRVPLGGRRDFAPCQRDILLPPSLRVLQYRLSILCIKHRVPFQCQHRVRVQSRRDMPESKKFLLRFVTGLPTSLRNRDIVLVFNETFLAVESRAISRLKSKRIANALCLAA